MRSEVSSPLTDKGRVSPQDTVFPTAGGELIGLATGIGRDSSAGTVVLVHGIQGTASIWRDVLPELGRDRRAIAPNFRGRGGSPVPEDVRAYRMEDFSGELASVLDGMDGPVVLVGWSMGSLVALDYVRQRGTGRLSGLALVSGTPGPLTTGTDKAVWFKGETAEEIAEEARLRAERLNLSEAADPVAVAGAWMAARSANYRPEINSLNLPCLILHGDADPECPVSHARLMAERIALSRLEIWEGCGHMPMIHAPRILADTLRSFATACIDRRAHDQP